MKKLITGTLLFLGLLVAPALADSNSPSTYHSTHITTATTTTIRTGAGSLRGICINTLITSGSVTADDNTSATTPTLAIITNPSVLLGEGPVCAYYNIAFYTGLTIVTVGAQDVTVMWDTP